MLTLALGLLVGRAPAVADEGPSTAASETASSKPAPARPKPLRIEDFAPPEEFVMVDTVKTHFVCKGETGPPVVLVHGFGSSTFTWQKTIDALADKHQVYALDLKGFGLSAKPKDGQYNLEVYTNHLLGFLGRYEAGASGDRGTFVLGGAIAAAAGRS